MKLVVDTNILITFFWKYSFFRIFSVNQELELISPEYALEEINKHSQEILKKTNLSKKEFNDLKKELAIMITFIPLHEYSSHFRKVQFLTKDLSEKDKKEILDDIDFLALGLKQNCPIWTNDKIFKKQSAVKIFTTEEIIEAISDLLET